MSTEQRQDRTERSDRTPQRGRGRGRGNYTGTSRGRGGGGHARQQSYGYSGYPNNQMFAPAEQFVPMMNPQGALQGTMPPPVSGFNFPQQFQPSYGTQNMQKPQGEPVKLVQKAETKGAALDFKAMIAAKMAQSKLAANAPAAKDAAKEPVKDAAKETPKETAAPKEAPKEAVKEAPKEASKEVIKEAPKETPKETVSTPKEASKEAPTSAVASSSEARVRAMREQVQAKIAAQAALRASQEAAKQQAKEQPQEQPKEALKEAPKEASKEASKEPEEAPKQVPQEEPKPTEQSEPAAAEVNEPVSAAEAEPKGTETEAETENEQSESTEADAPPAAALDSKWAEDNKEEKEDDEAGQVFAEHLKSARLVSEGQVYPENVPGTSKPYSVDFLMMFKEVVPPINRKALREIVNVEAQKGQRSMSSRRGGGGSLGRMSRNASNASLSRGGRNNSRRQPRQGSSRKDKDEPLVPVAPLVRGENAWVPRTLKVTDDGKVETAAPVAPTADLLDEAEVERRVKSLLNKMSLDNLDRIAVKIIDIANQSKYEPDCRTLKQIVGLTFDKACDEPHWSAMYAKFCVKLHDVDPEITDESAVDKDGKLIHGQRLFRRILLGRCQTEFEKGWSVAETEESADVMSDAYYAAVKAKRHGLGLVRFVGELFKSQFVSEKIIHSCFVKLAKETPSEEIVESACKLVTTTAPYIQSKELLDFAMGTLHHWRTSPGFPSRLRFMIMDVEEAHQNGWKLEDKGPKTLAEVHQEVENEQAKADSEKRGRGMPAFGSTRRNDRDTSRRMDKERQKVPTSSFGARQQNARPEKDDKKEAMGNRFDALNK